MSVFSKHLGTGEPLVINGEEFNLKSLDIEFLPHFFKVMKSFSGAGPNANTEDILKNMDDVGLNSLKVMIDETLKRSYPNDDENERKQFGLKYMGQLMGKIMELNSAEVKTMSKQDRLKAAKAIHGR